MSCSAVVCLLSLAMSLMAPQVCVAGHVEKKHHHHAKHKVHVEEAPEQPSQSNVDKFLKENVHEKSPSQFSDKPNPNDPNDFGLMDRATLDREFPTFQENTKAYGIFDFRTSNGHHPIIEDTPEKMSEDYAAMANLRKVNALSHVHINRKTDDDDEDDD